MFYTNIYTLKKNNNGGIKMGDEDVIMVNNEECFKHVIKLNNYIQTEILIPKELDVVKFEGIVKMANSFFKLSSKTITNNNNDIKQNEKRSWKRWSDEDIDFLTNEIENGTSVTDIASKMNRDINTLYPKISYLKLKTGKKSQKIKSSTNIPSINSLKFKDFSDEKIKELIIWWKQASTEDRKSLSEPLGKTTKQFKDKLKFYMNKFNM